MLADVDDRVRAELVRQPLVRGQVVVARRQVGVVVDRDGVLPEAARRLHHDDDVPGAEGGEHDVAALDEQLPGRRAPVQLRLAPEHLGEGAVPALVGRRRDADRIARELLFGEPVLVLPAAAMSAWTRASPSCSRTPGSPRRGRSGLVEPCQEPHGARRGVESDGVAHAGVLRRVRRQHHHDAPLGGRGVPQPPVPDGDPGDPRGPLRIGPVDGEAVLAGLLERERDGDDPPVELGDRDLRRGVQRGEAVVARLPLGAARREAEPLEDRDVQGGQRAHVPRLVVAPAPAVAGLVPPAARTVTTSASASRSVSSSAGSAVRSDEQNTGSARPPASSTASHRASTKSVFPAMWWAR